MILLNLMCVEIIAKNVQEPRHKHALQKVVNNIGLVSEKWFLLV